MQIQIQSGYQILEIDFGVGSWWGFPQGESRRRHCNVDKTNTKNTQTELSSVSLFASILATINCYPAIRHSQ